MNNKVYLTPKARVVLIEDKSILAGSGTGATGEDVPWATKRRNYIFDAENDNE